MSDQLVPEPTGDDTSTKTSRGGWRSLAIAAAVIAIAYAVLVVAVGREIPTGTRVGGYLNIGGMSASQAQSAIYEYAQQLKQTRLHFYFKDQKFDALAGDLGLVVDEQATLAQVPVNTWNPITMVAAIAFGIDYPLVVDDGTELQAQIDAIVATAETQPQDATIKFEAGSPVVVPARPGQLVDRQAVVEAVLKAAAGGFYNTDIKFKLQRVEPNVKDEVAHAYIDSTVRGLIQDSVTITVVDHPDLVNVYSVEDLRTAMRFRSVNGQLQAYLQPGVLAKRSNPTFLEQTQPVQDATWDVSSGTPVVVPSESGFGVSSQALATAVESVWDLGAGQREASVTFGKLDPKVTTESIANLGVNELISSYTQNFPAAAYRSQNIGQAAAYINGTLLLPGAEFSMNDTIRERTEENGYTSGWIIGANGVFQYEPGGGVSTATTAMFNAAFFAGLKFKEWRAHSIFISRYPAGREATVSWGSLDMRFVNNYDTAVFITTHMTKTSITVKFWGTKHWDKIESVSGPWTSQTKSAVVYNDSDQCHSQDPVPGFHITVYRVFYKAELEVKREAFNTSYRSTPKVICGSESNSPTKKPTPTKTTKPPKPTATPSESASATPSETATSTP